MDATCANFKHCVPAYPSDYADCKDEMRMQFRHESKFIELIGAKLTDIGRESATYVGLSKQKPITVDSVRLIFDLGALVIENPFTVDTGESLYNSSEDGCETIMQMLIGAGVADAEFRHQSIDIRFDNGYQVSISLRDEDFSTPEAGNYQPNNGPIIVFD